MIHEHSLEYYANNITKLEPLKTSSSSGAISFKINNKKIMINNDLKMLPRLDNGNGIVRSLITSYKVSPKNGTPKMRTPSKERSFDIRKLCDTSSIDGGTVKLLMKAANKPFPSRNFP